MSSLTRAHRRIFHTLLAVFLVAQLTLSGTPALAQSTGDNPLVGTWQGTFGPTTSGSATMSTIEFAAACYFKQEIAIAPSHGQAGAIIRLEGTYQVSGSDSYDYRVEHELVCADSSLNSCQAYAPGDSSMPNYYKIGIEQEAAYRIIDGQNAEINGAIYIRLR